MVALTGLPVVKGHGTGNDFLILPDPDGRLALTPLLVRALCHRRSGIGADGILRVVRTAAEPEAAHLAAAAEWFMDYRNSDGGSAEMWGNGVRVYARYLVAAGLTAPGGLRLATRSGIRDVRVEHEGDVTVDMGTPASVALDAVRVHAAGRDWPATAVSMGNPHAVAVLDRLADAGGLLEPPTVSPADAFPDGVNIEFVVPAGADTLQLRVYERGVGETCSCGTGACAVVAAVLARAGRSGPADYRVEVPGGRLAVTVGPDGRYLLSGDAVLVADAQLRPEWLAELDRRP